MERILPIAHWFVIRRHSDQVRCPQQQLRSIPLYPPTWTGTWRDPSKSPPADGGRPENSLTGTIFMVNGPATDNPGNLSIKVPAAYGKMRFWRNTTIANLAAGQTAILPAGTLGYEWDEDLDNGARPAGTFDLSFAAYNLTADLLLDQGGVYGAGTATHQMTLHRAPSGALVFGAGTIQWAWGLDANHDNPFQSSNQPADPDMQQAVVNSICRHGCAASNSAAGVSGCNTICRHSPASFANKFSDGWVNRSGGNKCDHHWHSGGQRRRSGWWGGDFPQWWQHLASGSGPRKLDIHLDSFCVRQLHTPKPGH